MTNDIIGWRELVLAFGRIGLLSFGGPAAQIALMHRELVEERKWLDEARFLHALNFCMLLPGPEAMQLATYCGWLKRGIPGGLVAGLLFVLPGALVVTGLAALYLSAGDATLVAGLLFGLKAAVIAVVVEALTKVAKRALKRNAARMIAVCAFVALAVFSVPFPVVIAAAALAGFLFMQSGENVVVEAAAPVSWSRTLLVVGAGLTTWFLPIFFMDGVLAELAWFFSGAAVVTFGGAYSVLSHVGDVAVSSQNWLTSAEMATGLGLAETTPGPLILVLAFVGFLASARESGLDPLFGGLAGAGVALWFTFVPCFLWIFAGAPYVERVRGLAGPAAALAGVTAAVVGVIADLALSFAMVVFFPSVNLDPLDRLAAPDMAAVAIGLGAGIALMGLRIGLLKVLAGAMIAGILLRYAGLA